LLTDHLAAARTGDPGAVNAFLSECVPLVRMTAIRILGAGNDMVDDAIQEVLIKIWRNLHRFNGGNIEAWIVTVASNASHDVRLSAMHRHWCDSVSYDTLKGAASGDNVEATVCRHEDRRRVRDAIGKLYPTYQPIAWLTHVEGFKAQEAAEMLGVAAATVYAQVKHAKAMLGKILIEN
jgi:RNA polymerase sigma-70 factor (ECF subfamily)